MGEKGNIVDAAGAVTESRSVITGATGVVTSTVVQAADSLRDKVVTTTVDHTIDEARDRLRQRGAGEAGGPADPDEGPR